MQNMVGSSKVSKKSIEMMQHSRILSTPSPGEFTKHDKFLLKISNNF